MLVRVALWTIVLCLILIFFAKMFLLFAVTVFAILMTKIAAYSLLIAFSLLGIAILGSFLGALCPSIKAYFSDDRRGQRYFLFLKNQHAQKQRLFEIQHLQLRSLREIRYKRMLDKSNRRNAKMLSSAIERDLNRIRDMISQDYYIELYKENCHYRTQRNIAALLELHFKILPLLKR
jgi:hypothetical protein